MTTGSASALAPQRTAAKRVSDDPCPSQCDPRLRLYRLPPPWAIRVCSACYTLDQADSRPGLALDDDDRDELSHAPGRPQSKAMHVFR